MALSSRRVLLGAFALAPGLAFTLPAFAASPSASVAKQFISQAGARMVSVVNGNGSVGQKAAALRQIVDQDVAVSNVGQFVLGRYWRIATPAQRSEYMGLFHQLLSNNITTQIRAYQGITFTVLGASNQPEGEAVSTVIARPNEAPAHVQWVVQTVAGAPKIVDVVVEGTSLRVTERADYSSVINDNGGQVSALIAAMKHQIAGLKAKQG
jgi:phospholipid transport system substrate-binding protein